MLFQPRGDRGPLLRFAPFQHSTHVFGVSELAAYIGSVLSGDPILQDVWLRGEIVGLSRSPGGHFYFSLKDDGGQLRCVLFRGNTFNSPVQPANGLAVVAHGVIRFYDRHGTCELVADLLFPEGVGLAQIQRETLHRRLEAEGLFEPSRKRRIPTLPKRIGVVTSDKGAVIDDLLSVLRRRCPLVEVVFVPAPVQGVGAAAAIERALGRLGRWRSANTEGVDVIVLARGGGSDEDLAAFNDERLARAVFASPVPLVSAVGHERDLTLVDLVADLRAPTASAAAELIAPDLTSLRRDVQALRRRALSAVSARVRLSHQACRSARERLADRLAARVRRARQQVGSREAQLRVLDPSATLARGYAIAQVDGRVLRDASDVQPGQRLLVQLHRGSLDSTVTDVRGDGGSPV
jgi:exodeoxyribonuclease VII large subunit